MFEIKNVKKRYERALFAKKGVVACGIGYKEVGGKRTDELCVVVSVEKKVPFTNLKQRDIVPRSLEGIATDVQETGVIRALQERTDRWRPAPGGVSIGHPDITAGTLGCLAAKDDEIFILSNNHVLANSNEAEKGDPIIQPGTHDGGTVESDQIATLEDFVAIDFLSLECPFATGTVAVLNLLCRLVGSSYRYRAERTKQQVANLVDCAIARPIEDGLVTSEILEIGVPIGTKEGELGLPIIKSGRTTGVSMSEISQTDVMVQVMYGEGKLAMFEDQLMSNIKSAGGDSGSAVLTPDLFVVGLLFAGSETTTIFNRIQNVMDGLGVVI